MRHLPTLPQEEVGKALSEMIRKVQHDYIYGKGPAYIWICKMHGSASNSADRCPCLENYPCYEYDDGKDWGTGIAKKSIEA